MTVYLIDVTLADGDDWGSERWVSRVQVEASSEREARLIAEQVAYTPQRGKPEHVQIVGTVRLR